jgi:hypothetical protein
MGMTAQQKAREYYAKNSEHLKPYFRNYSKKWRRTNVASAMLSRAKGNAKSRGLEFKLSRAWLDEKLAVGCCEVSKLPFNTEEANAFYPSIDRIDNSVGYLPSNCRLVVWIFNMAKNKYSDTEVMTLAKALVENSGCSNG